MSRHRTEAAFAALETELKQERAATLGRIGSKLEAELERCRTLYAELTEHSDDDRPATRLARRERYRQAYCECEQLRWMLCVQRESMGLLDHSWVNRVFPLPPAPLTA